VERLRVGERLLRRGCEEGGGADAACGDGIRIGARLPEGLRVFLDAS
jgi:hypothetical protein